MLWKFFERVPKTKNPNTQGGPGLSSPWWEIERHVEVLIIW